MSFYFILESDVSIPLSDTSYDSTTHVSNLDQIWNALDGVVLPSGARWVSPTGIPMSKVVQTNSMLNSQAKVTNLLQIDGPYTENTAQTLAQRVAQSADGIFGSFLFVNSPTVVRPYSPASDGSLAAWQGGSIANPRVIDDLPNPSLHQFGVTINNALDPIGKTLKQALTVILVGGLVVGAIVVVPRVVQAYRFVNPKPRSNPRRRTKR